jgi:hypothetical protein
MILCEEEVVTLIKNKIPLGKQGLSLLFSLRGRRLPATVFPHTDSFLFDLFVKSQALKGNSFHASAH